MSTPRLTFLYPHLFRAPFGRWAAAAAEPARAARGRARCQRAAAPFTTTTGQERATFAPRHGKAVEPIPLGPPTAAADAGGRPRDTTAAGRDDAARATAGRNGGVEKENKKKKQSAAAAAGAGAKGDLRSDGSAPEASDALGGAEQGKQEGKEAQDKAKDNIKKDKSGGLMETVLHMGPPQEGPAAAQRQQQQQQQASPPPPPPPPPLSPPKYVHHFDSYSLVKQLEEGGGYTQAQAITAMKAVRRLLAHNLDVAQGGLVSKSDVENEAYLFKAACSELAAEVKNNRRVAEEQMRQQRTLLQHEVDIATQTLLQEVHTLNDTVRGMFNDRKMAVREEQKAADSAIQQINYKISVTLGSDAKSETEGLRWVLIRRSVVGILFMAVLTLGTLRYATYVGHEKQKEAERRLREADSLRRNVGKTDYTSGPDAAEILAAN